MCENGEWTEQLKCSPINATCNTVPKVKDGKVICDDSDKDPGTDNYLGGTKCKVTCDFGNEPTGEIRCIENPESKNEGLWSEASCGEYLILAFITLCL